jgi:hypothetical protein
MKSHTGGAFLLCKGLINGTSTKQNLNTRSSTERLDWTTSCPKSFGHNFSSGRSGMTTSSPQYIRIIRAPCYWLKTVLRLAVNEQDTWTSDKILSLIASLLGICIDYCPTGDMIADFFTKPLQCSLFQKFHDFIMNVDGIFAANADPRSVLQKEIATLNLNGLQVKTKQVHSLSVPTYRRWFRTERRRRVLYRFQIRNSTEHHYRFRKSFHHTQEAQPRLLSA